MAQTNTQPSPARITQAQEAAKKLEEARTRLRSIAAKVDELDKTAEKLEQVAK